MKLQNSTVRMAVVLMMASMFALPLLTLTTSVANAVSQKSKKKKKKAEGENAALLNAATLSEFISAQSNFEEKYSNYGRKVPAQEYAGGEYVVSNGGTEILSFQKPKVWPGMFATVKVNGQGDVTVNEVPAKGNQRSTLKLNSFVFAGEGNGKKAENQYTVKLPDATNVELAVGALRKKSAGMDTRESGMFYKARSLDSDQTALELGANGKFMLCNIAGQYKGSSSKSENALTVLYVERAFTVDVTPPSDSGSGFFTSRFKTTNARKWVEDNKVTVNRPLLYVSSVTYGRMLLLTISGEKSLSKLDAKLDGSFKKGAMKLSLSGLMDALSSGESEKISCSTVGGSVQLTMSQMQAGDGRLSEFFNTTVSLDKMVPIGYTLKEVKSNHDCYVSGKYSYLGDYADDIFSVRIVADFVDADDGFGGGAADVFGDCDIDGVTIWEGKRADSGKLQKNNGDKMTLKEDFPITMKRNANTSYHLTCRIKDADTVSDDDSMGDWDLYFYPRDISVKNGEYVIKDANTKNRLILYVKKK